MFERLRLVLAFCALSVGSAIEDRPAVAGPPDDAAPYQPKVEAASDEGQRAIAKFQVPEGLKVSLFAAEPMLANPVAFGVDEKNRFFVVETFRHSEGVTDTRGHMNWLDDDLASRTIEDRVAMFRKYLKPEEFDHFDDEHDRIRLLEDRDGDGQADHATVFADGFHETAAGLAAGVLARKGDVYFTCIPDLWLLRDTNGDGKADERTSLHRGYGIHVGFLGHDLHGLIFGPDGKLYFSIGDRALNVTTRDGQRLVQLESGSVLRCNPDGTDLEIVATGLRNPQELAFDEYGNLFSVDNNSDSGDRARVVYLVEGGDSGWRIGYQFLESPNSRGPWNSEKMWSPQNDEQPAFLVPPLSNLSDGPSGLAYNPGTALSEPYRQRFFLADFRGSSGNSGIRSFGLKPKGASFEVVDPQQFLWGVEVTDVGFGTDGALYLTDWVEGWNKTGKGRIYKVADPKTADEPLTRQVQRLLAEGMSGRPVADLIALLSHADMRIRQEAQFELADRGLAEVKRGEGSVREALAKLAARGDAPRLARLHAIWAIGQMGRTYPTQRDVLLGLVNDPDAEVRAQAIKGLGAYGLTAGSRGTELRVARSVIARALKDESPRVRFFAALALGKVGDESSVEPVLEMIRENDDADPYLRHAGVMALAGIGDANGLIGAAGDQAPSVRLAALLAWRRLGSPELARFLHDPVPRIVDEAARAINDVPIDGAMSELAGMTLGAKPSMALARRVVNACVRAGRAEDAKALAALASRKDLPEPLRIEAIEALERWEHPQGRDRIVGLWRPLPSRDGEPASQALAAVVEPLLHDGRSSIQRAAARAVASLKIASASAALLALLNDRSQWTQTRVEALKALDGLGDPKLVEAVTTALAESDSRLRGEGLRILARLKPEEAIPSLSKVLEEGSIGERQEALSTIGQLKVKEADRLLATWLDRLLKGQVPAEIQLDLLDASAGRSSAEVQEKLARFEAARPKNDPLAAYREALVGGDAARGERIFREKAEVSCLKCHKIRGEGGEVGPELTGLIDRKDRAYLLESIVTPNAQIAEGFETQVVATTDGQVIAGIVKAQDPKSLTLITAEAKLVTIPKDEIDEQKRGESAMPSDVIQHLSKSELRDLIEFLGRLK